MAYFELNGLKLSNGNRKLGNDTLILNMGSATECASAKRGLCKLGKRCYALKAEKLYPGCYPYRKCQQDYWLTSDWTVIMADLYKLSQKHKKAFSRIKYIRINEAGDFHTQGCIDKLDKLAECIKGYFGWTVYTYSARSDLDFSKVKHFNVKGSGWNGAPNGKTIARKMAKTEAKHIKSITHNGTRFEVCPMDCRDCTLCKVGTYNIVFPLH